MVKYYRMFLAHTEFMLKVLCPEIREKVVSFYNRQFPFEIVPPPNHKGILRIRLLNSLCFYTVKFFINS